VAALSTGIAVALGSGVAVGFLGIAVILSGSRRASTISFSAFLLVWSGLIIAGNLSRIEARAGNLAGSRTWLLIFVSFLTVIYIPLVHFAETFTTERGWIVRTRQGLVVLLAPAVVGGIAMLVNPSVYVEGFREIGGTIQSDWGPFFLVFETFFTVAFYLLVYRLVEQYREMTLAIERARARDLLLAVGLLVAFDTVQTSVIYGSNILAGNALLQDYVFVLSRALGLAVIAWAARALVREDPTLRNLAVGTYGLPAAFGAFSGFTIASPALPSVVTRGIWRLLAVAIIAYAALRYEMFDIDIQAARGAAFAGAFVAIVATGVGVSRLVETVVGSADAGTVTGVAAAGGLLLGLAYRRPGFFIALEDRLGARNRLDRRRLEVYEAALARDRSRDDPAGRALARLREDLDLGESEAAVLERLVAEGGLGGQAPEPEPGTVLGDRYDLETPAGSGRTGRAWVAKDPETDEPVVVKILDRPLSDRDAVYGFLRETRAARRVDHPNVVSVRDVGLQGNHPYLVLDHVAGGSLDDEIEKTGAMDPSRAVEVVDDVLAGLEALHEAGVVHRDVKAENVLLRPDGEAVLADLDLAGPVDPDATIAGIGDLGRAGTPATMSPEVAAGGDAGPASDVYALGALLHLLLTGEPYVDMTGARARDVEARIRSADPPSLPGAPDALKAVVRKALRTDPDERYQSAAAMRASLADAL
jgi:hypothetical protein